MQQQLLVRCLKKFGERSSLFLLVFLLLLHISTNLVSEIWVATGRFPLLLFRASNFNLLNEYRRGLHYFVRTLLLLLYSSVYQVHNLTQFSDPVLIMSKFVVVVQQTAVYKYMQIKTNFDFFFFVINLTLKLFVQKNQ